MEIPRETHPNWKKLVSGELKCSFEFLAVKILLGRLRTSYQMNPTPEVLAKCIHEARDLFDKNMDLPKVQNDLRKIFEGGSPS